MSPSKVEPLVIGVCGGSGSGKSTISKCLAEQLGTTNVVLLQQDYYYRDWSHLPPQDREKINFDHPDSIDWELFVKHVDMLVSGNSINAPIYSFISHTRTSYVHITSADIIIIDGHLLFNNQKLTDYMNFKIYVEVDLDLMFIRRLMRDIQERGRSVNSIVDQYLGTVKPGYEKYISAHKKQSDLEVSSTHKTEHVVSYIINSINKSYGYDRLFVKERIT